ncbi:cytoplasmic 60S subunit biogenesis factor ZNF622 [Phyllopteryx taeniolatus]|uniref:cytoplasmic 60S subunit biogenesis factor ZNF622 n=1 Tax=Phyllopteryx taeniolatus TaxID=161469 RepID=UPI002AD3F9CE|nr:cytoplasmic 60S subunit biogenesis factor ZNF622 [Phyllopteryx taeniolatus]
MSSYTCISCRVVFSDGEVQRAHYKSDWHRYNLKRKVADMPPVSAANFQERVLLQRTAAERHPSDVGEVCAVCNKKFCSANAFRNHLQSQRHQQSERQALQAAQQQVDKLNQKNLEKGFSSKDKEDRDARNEALRQAFKEQCRTGQKEAPVRSKAKKAEKPPRLVWLEEQAKRREREEGATAEEEEWEDMDEDDDDEDMEEEDEDEDEPTEEKEGDPTASSDPQQPAITILPGSIPVTDCLFCSHHSKSLLRNVAHMTHVHSFFIPDLQYLVDLRGLVRYLGEKVGAGNVCLWCNEKGRSFYSTEAVQGHMTDKSHCKLFTDGDAALEFADFYDFRTSYPERGHDDMDDEELPDDKNFQYDDETMELTLPSGARIGHRSLMRYYKQRFGNERTLVLSHNRNAVGRVLRQYKALGWAGDAGLGSVHRVHRDMQYVQMMKSKWMLKMGLSHNATKQKHFRPQVIF